MNVRLQSFFEYQALEQERAEATLESGAKENGRSLAEIEAETEILLPDIEPAIRQRIKMLIRHGETYALVALEAGAYCGHCHRRLTPREAQRLSSGDVITCERCNRIVYLADEVAA